VKYDPETFGQQYVEAVRAWGREHPTVTWLNLMNMQDLASSKKELGEWLADPEAWIAAHPELPSNID